MQSETKVLTAILKLVSWKVVYINIPLKEEWNEKEEDDWLVRFSLFCLNQ